jgi:prevent-host-death family protein
MKRFTVAEARARFGDVLDEADQGETVIIERRGVQYTITPRRAPRRRKSSAASRYFEWVDPAVMSGQWTWTTTKSGLRFTPRARKRR